MAIKTRDAAIGRRNCQPRDPPLATAPRQADRARRMHNPATPPGRVAMSHFRRALLAVCLLSCAAKAQDPAPPAAPTVIKAAHLFDARDGPAARKPGDRRAGYEDRLGRRRDEPARRRAHRRPWQCHAAARLHRRPRSSLDGDGGQLVPAVLPEPDALPRRRRPARGALRGAHLARRIHDGAQRGVRRTTPTSACAMQSATAPSKGRASSPPAMPSVLREAIATSRPILRTWWRLPAPRTESAAGRPNAARPCATR